MRANDYPGMADIDSSLFLFCREVKKETTVVLSGECADEIFGGYPWFQANSGANDDFPWIRAMQERVKLMAPELVKLVQPEDYLHERYREAVKEVPYLEGESVEEMRMRELFYLNITRFMPTLLDRKDRMSMAWGLEVRVPFADHELLEYVWNIPWRMKNCDNMPKGILRRALQGLLPDDVILRRKSPYPKTHHPVYLSEVKKRVLKILHEPNSQINSLLNSQTICSRLLTGPAVFSRPWFGQLMGDAQYLAWIIQLNAWMKEYQVRLI
jgi:asparagine synthase (glutamine-hydrolysing)